METVISILHVVGAVFIVGPMAILPMSALRAARAGNGHQVAALARSTAIFSYLSLIVFLLGFALVGLADPKYELSITTPWVMASIVLYLIAVAASLLVVVPALRRAARDGDAGTAAVDDGGAAGVTAVAGRLAVTVGSGVVAVLLVGVVILMVWKP
ncbi:DUF2269 family protein [Herbiconiux sp. VKM Ac-1786]|uniref:DUF2269 family protein n=1 Tax=Herbiconiux sp. VKM Ac-1786 TaxID=2783824 RepID=UPI00188D275E|nr:DUF2269 family protein [Herbiconiux sp. VKM Ac-1786]MBF4571944.1 DUF2269 family protein [Herbiconiux sp. VKM Ac-1786]